MLPIFSKLDIHGLAPARAHRFTLAAKTSIG